VSSSGPPDAGPRPAQYEAPSGRGDRNSRILGGTGLRREGAKGVLIAVVSTVVVFTLLTVIVVNSPGWPEIHQAFFNGEVFRESFPDVLRFFFVNVEARSSF